MSAIAPSLGVIRSPLRLRSPSETRYRSTRPSGGARRSMTRGALRSERRSYAPCSLSMLACCCPRQIAASAGYHIAVNDAWSPCGRVASKRTLASLLSRQALQSGSMIRFASYRHVLSDIYRLRHHCAGADKLVEVCGSARPRGGTRVWASSLHDWRHRIGIAIASGSAQPIGSRQSY